MCVNSKHLLFVAVLGGVDGGGGVVKVIENFLRNFYDCRGFNDCLFLG